MSITGENRKFLVIPDLHQNSVFLNQILSRNVSVSFDSIVFLGDIFDAKDNSFDNFESLRDILMTVNQLRLNGFPTVDLLLGNHDVPYFYEIYHGDSFSHRQKERLYRYFGFPKSYGLEALEEFGSVFDDTKLVLKVGKYLLSHAGISSFHWDHDLAKPENIESINCLIDFPFDESGDIHPNLKAGIARGGDLPRGGVLWMDWEKEFLDELQAPQVVGHTAGIKVRKKGRSYCLDASQSCYGVISGDDDLEVFYV